MALEEKTAHAINDAVLFLISQAVIQWQPQKAVAFPRGPMVGSAKHAMLEAGFRGMERQIVKRGGHALLLKMAKQRIALLNILDLEIKHMRVVFVFTGHYA